MVNALIQNARSGGKFSIHIPMISLLEKSKRLRVILNKEKKCRQGAYQR